MDIHWKSDKEFDIILTHSSEAATLGGTLDTSPEYEIRGKLPSGETISFGDYMRSILIYDYLEPEFAWDTVLYTIKPDETLTLNCNLDSTYGKLPDGSYVLCKPVTLTTESGERITKVYTVSFEIPSAVKAGSNPYFNAEVLEVNEKSILVKPDPDSNEIKSADKISVSLDVISTIPVPTFKIGDRVRVIYNGEITITNASTFSAIFPAESYPAQINKVFAIYLLSEDGKVLSPTPSN